MAEDWGPADRPWWSHAADAVAAEPFLSVLVLAIALPLVVAIVAARYVRRRLG